MVIQPDTIIALGKPRDLDLEQRLSVYLNPNFVDVVDQAVNIVVILIIGGILAAIVARSNRLAENYTTAERARFNLARHFSPDMVDELATADYPFGPVRRQDIAVIFADIVGFTNYTEEHEAETVFDLLRQFHGRMAQIVFANNGTVDNYIGDCIMATFGVPRPEKDDAVRAILWRGGDGRCAGRLEQGARLRRPGAGRHPHRLPVRAGGGRRDRQRAQPVLRRGGRHVQCRQPASDDVPGPRGEDLLRRGCGRRRAARRPRRRDLRPDRPRRVMVRGREAPVHVWIVPKD